MGTAGFFLTFKNTNKLKTGIVSLKIPVNVWRLSEARNGTCSAIDPQVHLVEVGMGNADYGSHSAQAAEPFCQARPEPSEIILILRSLE